MKVILLPVDFTESSEHAREVAISIAKQIGAEIHFLHVKETVEIVEDGKENDGFLFEKLNRFALKENGLKSKTFITEGVPYDEIINHSEEFKCNLIIISSSKKVSYHTTFTASNVLRITRLSNSPVLIIPEKSKMFEIKKVVFVNDFTFEFDYKEKVYGVFNDLINLMEEFKPEIELLYVNIDKRDEESIKANMENFASSFPKLPININITESESIEDGALAFSKNVKANILSIAGHGSGEYYIQLRTSISEKIISQSRIPLLMLRINS